MDLQLKNRRCLVTGASAGIGLGIVEALAQEGALVVATGRRGDKLGEIADSLALKGCARPAVVTGDITDAGAVKRIAAEAAEAFGPIEILVNCAGGSRPVTPEAGDDAWEESFYLNFMAARRMTAAVLPPMRKAKWGRIINITGLMEPRALTPEHGALSAGVAMKAATHLWAKGLSRDLGRDGITVNNVPPGRIDSEQVERLYSDEFRREESRNIPMGRFGQPRDIGVLVAFIASPLAQYITGTVIPVDGGLSFYGA
ncbi:3-oxoacyl-[acyl-carrier-protein] reductase FabG (plasmid) [Variovorax sp. SRS16]|uniref:SDR family NAD(P)-dependent oxidoreductase n=1 Tax=Variovorax sp. SRS16 TaxID=282217 RepID=UPI0013199C6B|nr:SDR family oxidoreductase [Variovorax sp. SRS16]VTU45399.1 3-oxoacyl-[acyl-carrier-protein] reductase FabG [Variovorax sp. SRS16]